MKTLLHWVRFNLSYLGRPPWDTGVSPPELIDFIRRNPPGRALDLGCGSGVNLVTLAEAGWQVVGVDFAWRAVLRARRRLQRAGLTGEVYGGDVTDLRPLKGSFDLVLDMGCYHGLPAASRAVYQRNLERLLAPGGYFMLYAFWGEVSSDLPAICTADVDALAARMRLVERQDGMEKGTRSSVWLTFQAGGKSGV